MSQVRVHNFSISLDGFGTGHGLTLDAPFGHAGERLHEWMFATRYWRSMVGEPDGSAGIDQAFAERHGVNIGAEIMGRGKFGPPQGGPWTGVGTDEEWRGWWGPNPPFHTPVFVLTHHPRPSIEMEGGTVFHFVTGGADQALALAREVAGDGDVRIGGGVDTIRQYLTTGAIDELHIAVSPVLLGTGESLFADIDLPALGYSVAEREQGERALHLVIRRS
jgi:dihydrofolate reductase